MSSAEKIKKLFAKSEVTVNSKVDDRIVRAALTALDESEKTRSLSAEPNIWRIIMKSRMTKLAAAVVIIIAVVIGVNQFGGSIDITTIAFADISEAMKNVPWMHTVTRGFERGTEVTAETWFSFEPKIFIGKTPDGPVVFTDYKNHSDYRYDPASNTITISYLSDDKPAIDLSSPWSALEKMAEVFTEQGAEITQKPGNFISEEWRQLQITTVCRSSEPLTSCFSGKERRCKWKRCDGRRY